MKSCKIFLSLGFLSISAVHAAESLPIGTFIMPSGERPMKITLNSDGTGRISSDGGTSSVIWKMRSNVETTIFLNKPIVLKEFSGSDSITRMLSVKIAPTSESMDGHKWGLTCTVQTKSTSTGAVANSFETDCGSSNAYDYAKTERYFPGMGRLNVLPLVDETTVTEVLEDGSIYIAKSTKDGLRGFRSGLGWKVGPAGFEVEDAGRTIRYRVFEKFDDYSRVLIEITENGEERLASGIISTADPEYVYAEEEQSQYFGIWQYNDSYKTIEIAAQKCEERFSPFGMEPFQYFCKLTEAQQPFTMIRWAAKDGNGNLVMISSEKEYVELCTSQNNKCFARRRTEYDIIDRRSTGLLVWSTFHYDFSGEGRVTDYFEVLFLTRK